MKKLLALLMALIMALSCCSALAEEPAQETGMTINVPAMTMTEEWTLNEEAIAALFPMFGVDAPAEMVQPIVSLLNNLGVKAVLADNGLQIDLSLKGQDVLTLAGELNEQGLAVASNLLPSYVLTLSPETFQQLMDQFMGQFTEAAADIDVNQLIQNVTGYAMNYVFTCMSAVTPDEPQTGEFYQESIDYTFNTCTHINVDMEVIKGAALTLIDQIKNDEIVGSLISTLQDMGMPVDFSEDVNIVVPQVEVYSYENLDENGLNADGVSFAVVEETFEDAPQNDVTVQVLMNGDAVKVIITLGALDSNIEINVQPSANGLYANVSTYIQEMFIGAELTASFGEGFELDSALYFVDEENPIFTEKLVVAQGGERTYQIMDEEKTALDVAALMADTEGELSGSLMMDLMMNGLGTVLGNAMQAMPEEVGALMNLMNGGSAVEETVEEIPAE